MSKYFPIKKVRSKYNNLKNKDKQTVNYAETNKIQKRNKQKTDAYTATIQDFKKKLTEAFDQTGGWCEWFINGDELNDVSVGDSGKR